MRGTLIKEYIPRLIFSLINKSHIVKKNYFGDHTKEDFNVQLKFFIRFLLDSKFSAKFIFIISIQKIHFLWLTNDKILNNSENKLYF